MVVSQDICRVVWRQKTCLFRMWSGNDYLGRRWASEPQCELKSKTPRKNSRLAQRTSNVQESTLA